jgi:hypothetical protein
MYSNKRLSDRPGERRTKDTRTMSNPPTPTNQRLLVGTVSVDSGQVMIGDPCYLHDWDANDYSAEAVATGSRDYDYASACAATLSPLRAGELKNGLAVVTSTAWGDGLYPVYLTYDSDGRVTKVEIIFDQDEDEDEEDGE